MGSVVDSPRLIDGPADASAVLLLAHGAGAPMDSPFMVAMAEGLAGQGWRVIRFDFAYMQRWRSSGRKTPPDRADRLMEQYRQQIKGVDEDLPLFIGGKSMGGALPACWWRSTGERGK